MKINGNESNGDIKFPDLTLDEPLAVLDDSLVNEEEVSDIAKPNHHSSGYRITRNLLHDSLASNNSFADSPSYMERHAKLIDSEKGLEVIGRQLATERNVSVEV